MKSARESGHSNPPSILLFGGSFDPIHHGHLIIARAVAERIGATRVVLIPAARSPFKPDAAPAPAADRLEMCRLAATLDPLFEVSDIELQRPPPSYAIDTVMHFRSTLSLARLFWLLGADSLDGLHKWRAIEELVKLVTFVTAARPGIAFSDWTALRTQVGEAGKKAVEENVLATPMFEVSSTEIRTRVRAGESIAYLVPSNVADYIARVGLYQR